MNLGLRTYPSGTGGEGTKTGTYHCKSNHYKNNDYKSNDLFFSAFISSKKGRDKRFIQLIQKSDYAASNPLFPFPDHQFNPLRDEVLKINDLLQALIKLEVLAFCPLLQHLLQHAAHLAHLLGLPFQVVQPIVRIDAEVAAAVAAEGEVVYIAFLHQLVEGIADGTFAGGEEIPDLVEVFVRRFGQQQESEYPPVDGGVAEFFKENAHGFDSRLGVPQLFLFFRFRHGVWFWLKIVISFSFGMFELKEFEEDHVLDGNSPEK